MAKVVVALGGNALGKTPEEQLELVKNTAWSLISLVSSGNQVVISHGNGPQVGAINLGMNYAAENGKAPAFPFPECGAMSQGYIGYHLQQSLQNELHRRWMNKNVVTMVTQVAVDPKDQAFENPTKPVGDFYTKEQAEAIEKEKGYMFVEDAGRGYRQVVPSPLPKRILEIDSINKLIEAGDLVIAGGGGGVPVIFTDDGLQGVPAVIDKDLKLFLHLFRSVPARDPVDNAFGAFSQHVPPGRRGNVDARSSQKRYIADNDLAADSKHAGESSRRNRSGGACQNPDNILPS